MVMLSERARAALDGATSSSFAKVKAAQELLGEKVRTLFEGKGLKSVAAEGFKAPGAVVSYTTDPENQSSKNSSPKACKPPLACHCNATKARTS
jgi:aspartate aminotransferase-like enzyme